MSLPPPPPLAEVLEKYQTLVLPAAGGAAFVGALVLALVRRAAFVAAALGAIAGLAVANWGQATTPTLVPWRPGDSTWQWLGFAAVVATFAGVFAHFLGQLLTRFTRRPTLAIGVEIVLRVGVCLVVAQWLVGGSPGTPSWAAFALGGVMALHWLILDAVARPDEPSRGNRATQIVLIQAISLAVVSLIALYAHSARLSDLATTFSASLFGLAVLGFAARVSGRGAIAVGAIALPTLLLLTRQTSSSDVPDTAYITAAAAPLALAFWLIPALHRRTGWAGWALRWGVVLVGLAVAVWLAARVETLPWEQEW